MKKILITGISGQDGSYLADLLIGKGFEVHGILRRSSTPNTWRIDHLLDNEEIYNKNLFLHYGDVTDPVCLERLIRNILPDEIYHLAAQSHVKVSFEMPLYTTDTIVKSTLTILETIKELKLSGTKNIKFYHASSSEMFGEVLETPQKETTPFNPNSPYACAKVNGHHLTVNYRRGYDLFSCNGVLFNHECLADFVPIIYKEKNDIKIDNISDFFKNFVDGDCGSISDNILIWDNNDWTKIKFASSFKHDVENNNKGLRHINSRNSLYSVTNDHVCFKDDGTEIKSIDFKVGDKVRLINYPEIQNNYNLDPDFCEIIGMLVGDGYINRSKNHGNFSNSDENIRNKFSTLWKKFGGESRYYASKSGFNKNKIVGRLDLFNIKHVLNDIDIYTNLTDVKHKRFKKIPYQILNSSEECMKAFLNGYNATDGLKKNPSKYKYKNFKTNSATLAAGLLFLISKTTGQKYNVTLEESNKWGRQIFYYSLNILSDRTKNLKKYETVKNLLQQELSQREINRITNISRHFIAKVKKGYIPDEFHKFKKQDNEIKKIIDTPEYNGYFYDLETESGTFHAGIGQGHIHNSPRRGETFVTRKIIKGLVDIVKGRKQKLHLGNIDAKRDWGHAKDYVEGMYLMLQQEKPDDYVLATGETHTVKEFLEESFRLAGLNWEDYVVIDSKYFRPSEVDLLLGDATKAKEKLDWEPKIKFKELVKLMFEEEMKENK
jgi:GDPmannose 4,6-dehydratase